MIYEFRTYDLKVRSVPQVLENFEKVIEKRQELSNGSGRVSVAVQKEREHKR